MTNVLHRQKIQKAMWQHKNATKNFDYTTITDRLRTVSWGNDSHPTGMVKPDNGIPTFPLRGRPFDSEGGLALFGNKYSDLENAGNK